MSSTQHTISQVVNLTHLKKKKNLKKISQTSEQDPTK